MDGNQNQKEEIIYKKEMLPYGLYMPRPEPYFWGDIPWHWHDEFEFAYLESGKILYKIDREDFILQEGDGIFVNSGALHYLQPLDLKENVRLQVQFVDRSFLAGAPGSLLDIKYIAPMQEQARALLLERCDERGRKILEKMEEAAQLCLEEGPFFELRLRSIYSEIWELLFSWAMEKREGKGDDSQENERMKKMLAYIQEKCLEDISISDIAASISVSERECYRLFQNSLGTTPVKFLISCRLQKAQELLLGTEKSILEIAMETGFGSSSYFGKLFKRHHHITPGQYRKMGSSVRTRNNLEKVSRLSSVATS